MIDILFYKCAKFLMDLGNHLHLSYKEISVIFNLYLQGGILMVSALLPAIINMYSLIESPGAVNVAIFLYAILNVFLFCVMLHHYHLPMNYAFVRCADDLECLAFKLKTTYNMVNIMIFVVGWLLLLTINLLLLFYVI